LGRSDVEFFFLDEETIDKDLVDIFIIELLIDHPEIHLNIDQAMNLKIGESP
jgi:hypothetical protein